MVPIVRITVEPLTTALVGWNVIPPRIIVKSLGDAVLEFRVSLYVSVSSVPAEFMTTV